MHEIAMTVLHWTPNLADDIDARNGMTARYIGVRVGETEPEFVIIGRGDFAFQAYALGAGNTLIPVGVKAATLDAAYVEVDIYLCDTIETTKMLARGDATAAVPARREPVTVPAAMADVLRIARRLSLPEDERDALALGDLADLLTTLGEAVRAHGAMLSARVVAAQHARSAQDAPDDARRQTIAKASADTVRDATSGALAALHRVGDRIIAYGTRD